jgi:acyl carrier protein
MNREEITWALSPIFHRVFNDDEIIITDDLNAEKVDQWDSLTHLNMIAEVEKHFEIKFKLKELIGMKNVGDMIDLILQKKGA